MKHKGTKEIKTQVEIGVSRSNSKNGTTFHMTITDAASNQSIISMDMNHEQFANLVSGLHGQVVPAEVFVSDKIGKEMKSKVIEISLEGYDTARDWKKFTSYVEKFVKEFYPSWEVQIDTSCNSHRIRNYPKPIYQVTIRSWLE